MYTNFNNAVLFSLLNGLTITRIELGNCVCAFYTGNNTRMDIHCEEIVAGIVPEELEGLLDIPIQYAYEETTGPDYKYPSILGDCPEEYQGFVLGHAHCTICFWFKAPIIDIVALT